MQMSNWIIIYFSDSVVINIPLWGRRYSMELFWIMLGWKFMRSSDLINKGEYSTQSLSNIIVNISSFPNWSNDSWSSNFQSWCIYEVCCCHLYCSKFLISLRSQRFCHRILVFEWESEREIPVEANFYSSSLSGYVFQIQS